MSSGVPPRPPVTIRWSTRPRSRRTKSPIAAGSSGTAAETTTLTPSVSSRWASQVAFVFATSPETTSLPIVRMAALVTSVGYSRAAGHIHPGRCSTAKPVRIRRCPATAMPFGDEPGRLCHADERQPSEEGAFVRTQPPEPTSSADKRRFFVVTVRSAGLLALALALLLVPAASPAPAATPQRIVSLSPTATEDLFAIGAGPQVVAVDDQSNYPANAPKTKLSGYTPNAEAIASYKPDLVVVSANPSGLVAALAKLHIPTLLEPPAQNLNGRSEDTRLNSSHVSISYAVFCLKKK